ncbi:hypothetical protein DPEC_G00018500 [Dallia pectoralis]|uniref:Uncharacterized protein n=1 Tax=Dallia pectoralis TaxID=75939 RepID=A0ACC2HGB5_DALPE|nr:hypothetical protein DPEC_G00018500 [Dallia pectoralis]
MAAAKARAKVEAARTRAAFLQKESEILIEKTQRKVTEACIEASLTALQHEKEVAAAEAKVLEEAAENQHGDGNSTPNEALRRNRDYLQHQSQLESTSSPRGVEPYSPPLMPITYVLKGEAQDNRKDPMKKAWERLEECYGSAEKIEKSHFDRIETFPKISNRDALKLRELGTCYRT